LLAGDEAVGEPAVYGGRNHAQYPRRLLDVDEFSLGRFGRCLEARDLPIATKIGA
jgi:hypothetical protein